jgi:hypothetical protein
LTILALTLSVGLVPAFSGAAGAVPRQGGTMSRVSVHYPGDNFLERAWGFISCLWTEEGCSIDPLGTPSNKDGSVIDPLGGTASEAGSGFDPLGAPAAANPVEAGCSIDPLGGLP